VWNALKETVSGAIDKVEKLLGIRSPSRVFFGIGAHTSAGMAGGIAAGGPAVHRESRALAEHSMLGAHAGFAANDNMVPWGSNRIGIKTSSDEPVRPPNAPPPPPASGPTVQFNNCTFGEGTSEALIRRWTLNALEGEVMGAVASGKP
jgi:hypothetical protein